MGGLMNYKINLIGTLAFLGFLLFVLILICVNAYYLKQAIVEIKGVENVKVDSLYIADSNAC